jgi:hypothetical protein
MELRGRRHQQAGQPWASFLLSKPFLYQLLSMLHISVSAPAAKQTQSIKNTITQRYTIAPSCCQMRKASKELCKCNLDMLKKERFNESKYAHQAEQVQIG